MDNDNATQPNQTDHEVRLDKWLWAARFYKTRSLAAKAVEAGHVKLNEQRVKPSRHIHPGQCVALLRGAEHIEVIVQKLSTMRGPAPVAATLYAETEASRANRAQTARPPPGPSIGPRPTKRERRSLDRLQHRGT